MLKTQALIKELGYKEAIKVLSEEPYHLQIKEYDNFAVFNYNQIFSPDTDDYVMECRSLMLDKKGEVISRAYPRFFNYGQHPDITGKFEFEGSKIFEKADGSLIRIYWNPYDNRWEIATRGTAFAEGPSNFYSTFRQAVLEDGFGVTEEEFQYKMESIGNNNLTYVFEYCSMKNRIVTPYKTPQMVYITAFINVNGSEMYEYQNLRIYHLFWDTFDNVRLIKSYPFESMDKLTTDLENIPDLEEGYVCLDKNGLRIKMKSSLYMKVHKLRGEGLLTQKKIAELVADNEHEEFLIHFPEYKEEFEPYENGLFALFTEIDLQWELHHKIESQKDFAIQVKDLPYSAILFSMRKTGRTIQELWDETRLENRAGLLINYLAHGDL
jgi:hypothetical protein